MPNYFQKAINATFYANPVKLQQLIDEKNFYSRLLEDTGLLSKPFPIWRIPQCWEEAMGNDPNEYNKEDRDTVRDFMERNQKIKHIFQSTFHVEYTPIDYQAYSGDYFAADPDYTQEDIVDDPIEVLAKYGTTQQDVDLYCAVERFEYPKVIELLKQGANPYSPTCDGDRSSNAFWRIEVECSHLLTNKLAFAVFTEEYERRPVGWEECGDLVGWAAHEKMFRILEEYNTCPEPVYDD